MTPAPAPYMGFLPRFKLPVMERTKTFTLRSRRIGRLGSIVQTPFGPIRIEAQTRTTAGQVRDRYWREEGCESPEDFEAVWKQIHGEFDPEWSGWLHRFRYLGPPGGVP